MDANKTYVLMATLSLFQILLSYKSNFKRSLRLGSKKIPEGGKNKPLPYYCQESLTDSHVITELDLNTSVSFQITYFSFFFEVSLATSFYTC